MILTRVDMRYDVLTLFPDMFAPVLHESVIGRAVKQGFVDLRITDIRGFSRDKHKKTDDYPYGGGGGMIMTAQPLYDAWRSVAFKSGAINAGQFATAETSACDALTDEPSATSSALAPPSRKATVKAGNGARTIFMSPQGARLTQKKAIELSRERHLIIICGHYEGVDERALELIVDEEVSIGDYVLTGGEIPAMALIDCVSRLISGVLSGDEAYMNESHYGDLLEYPQYTRPERFLGMDAPRVLLEGNHSDISEWRREAAIARTKKKRPDLLASYPRRIPVGAACNMRDLGGYPASGGFVTRWRAFFRSDLISNLSEQDAADLHCLGLTTAIDLRSKAETERLPCAFARTGGVDYYNVSLLSEAAIDKSILTAPFKELYILFAERGKKKLARVFSIMVESRGACLVHCYAGKDRTGIVAALLLLLAGVSKEDVVADYEVSEIYYRRKIVNLDAGVNAPAQAHVRSERETIEYFVSHIEKKYGGAEGYLLNAGIAESKLSALKAKFLAPCGYKTAWC